MLIEALPGVLSGKKLPFDVKSFICSGLKEKLFLAYD